MNKKIIAIITAGAIVVAGFVALTILLLSSNSRNEAEARRARETADSLQMANEQMLLDNEYTQIQADFSQYENQAVYLKDDTLVQQYNESKARVEKLMSELDRERRSNRANQAASREKIKKLEAEIGTLRGIVRHYLEEIQRLGKENEGLRTELSAAQEQNQSLSSQVQATSATNAQLTQTVKLARKLNITGLTLTPYNRKDKREKNVTKAAKLGVSFTVSPNNTAAAGQKTFYIRILSPEGALLGGAGTFTFEGAAVGYSAARTVEYDNGELPVAVYWPAGSTTLTRGDYTVEVFCDGYRLGSRRVSLAR